MSVVTDYVGKAIERLEDQRFLRGSGCYVDDLAPEGVLHAAIFRSAVAHGRIRKLDIRLALEVPGVVFAFTCEHFSGRVPLIPMRLEPQPALMRFLQPVLAHLKVRYVGEPIAVIVAQGADIAEDACALVEIDIEPLDVVDRISTAREGGVTLFEEHATNLATTVTALRGNTDVAFAEADYVRHECFRVQRHTAVPLETRGILAEWDPKRQYLKVYGAMKVPFATRALLAKLLDLSESDIEVMETDVGSGFGVRGEFYPEDFLIPYAARRLGRPVKWIEDRREHFLATNHARQAECELEIACRKDGTVLALRGGACYDMGAYIRPNAVTAPRNLAQMISGPYRIPNVHMDVSMVLTNKTPSASYRGPGRFEADFFRERMLDLAAQDLGIDRVELRRRNLVTDADMPYPLAALLPYGTTGEFDSGDHRVTFERCLCEFGWAEKSALQGRLIDGRYHGLGIGCFVEGGATGPRENARLVLRADSLIEVYVGSSAIGQGLETIFAQIAADALGVRIERIRGVFHGSTNVVREGFGSHASRGTVMGGSAIIDAAHNLKEAIRNCAAEQFGCSAKDVEFVDDLAAVRSGPKFRTLTELAPDGVSAEGTFENTKRTYSYGTHAAHIAVDPRTGHIEVLEYLSVEDVGRIINPGTLHGQVIGAIVQGLGGAILEKLIYDESGQLNTASLADYLLPTTEDFPNIKSITLERYPSPNNPLGAKGAGEGGIIPVGGVIANAVASALGSFGVQPYDLPLAPPAVWQLIEAARTAAHQERGM